jgi:hypothetical protein
MRSRRHAEAFREGVIDWSGVERVGYFVAIIIRRAGRYGPIEPSGLCACAGERRNSKSKLCDRAAAGRRRANRAGEPMSNGGTVSAVVAPGQAGLMFSASRQYHVALRSVSPDLAWPPRSAAETAYSGWTTLPFRFFESDGREDGQKHRVPLRH